MNCGPIRSLFCHRLAALNDLRSKGFRNWVFDPGMLFGSCRPWWEPAGQRPAGHEGLDLCLYADASGTIRSLTTGMLVPAFSSGQVAAVILDFLGQSIVLSPSPDLVIIQAHVQPLPFIEPGIRVEAGEPIAAIAGSGAGPAQLLPHVHISLGRPVPGLDLTSLTWPDINQGQGLELMDPLEFMDCDGQVLEGSPKMVLPPC